MRDRMAARRKAEALVAKMTVEERASQLRFDSPAIDRLGIPEYNWWNEALHGVARAGTATMFPQAIAMAAMFDPLLMRQIADAVATEARAKYNEAVKHNDTGIYKCLSFWTPNINIFRDPRWGRGHETYGEDPYLTGRLGCAYIKGLQGDGDVMKTSACAKHFAVHSGPEDLRHRFDATCSKKDLWETYLPAFETCVKDGGVESVMGAYNRANGEPCCGSKTLLADILRGKWGFEGHVVSDCWAIQDFHLGHKVTATPEESAAMAINNGCDLNCGSTFIHLMEAYKQGLVTEETITEAAVRMFTTRYLLGIMEGSEYDNIPYEKVECAEHIALSEKAAGEACVLLKNDGILPLDKTKLKTLGVIGPNANSRRALMGNYYGEASRYITVLEGIQDELEGGARVLYAAGSQLIKERSDPLARDGDGLEQAVTVAQHSDAVILVLGLDESLEGEEFDAGNAVGSGDKSDLLLPAVQRRLLDKVLACNKPTVLVLMAGSSVDITPADEKANGILLAWYPGARGGKAVADILFGKTPPSGKLPVTFYRNAQLERMPEFTDYSMAGRTYRYINFQPLYPFGFGLTYGKPEVTELAFEDGKASVTAQNLCDTATEDVLQLYIKADCECAPPNPVLCGFSRIKLAAWQTQTVKLKLPEEAFTVIDSEGVRQAVSGKFTLYAGFGQPDARSQALGVSCKKTELIR